MNQKIAIKMKHNKTNKTNIQSTNRYTETKFVKLSKLSTKLLFC